MGVLKSIRRRNQGMAGRMSIKKQLNYSSISDGSGATDHNDSKDDSADLFEAATPLFVEREIRTSSVVTAAPDQAAGPEVSPLPTRIQETPSPSPSPLKEEPEPFILLQKKPEETSSTPKRTPAEPIAPLGVATTPRGIVVQDESEWDSISHISGISTRSDSSNKSAQKNMSSEEIQKDLAELASSFQDGALNNTAPAPATVPTSTQDIGVNTSAMSSRTPAMVSPGPQDKPETLNSSKGSSSKVQSIIHNFEAGRVNVVGNDAKEPSPDRAVRILKRFDDKSDSGSKVSHVFEDDQDSANAMETSADSSPASVYSAPIETPALVSPEKTQVLDEVNTSTPKLEAVVGADSPTPPPAINGTIAPSFDGSTATVFTNNTSAKSSASTINSKVPAAASSTPTTPAAATATPTANTKPEEKDFSARVHEKLNAIEDTVRSIGAGKRPEFLDAASPSCDSFLSSPSAITANFKDSLQQIKKEINNFYENSSSGFASAAAKAEKHVEKIQCPQTFFAKAESDDKQEPQLDESNVNTSQESSYYTEDSTNYRSKESTTTVASNDDKYVRRTETQASF